MGLIHDDLNSNNSEVAHPNSSNELSILDKCSTSFVLDTRSVVSVSQQGYLSIFRVAKDGDSGDLV